MAYIAQIAQPGYQAEIAQIVRWRKVDFVFLVSGMSAKLTD